MLGCSPRGAAVSPGACRMEPSGAVAAAERLPLRISCRQPDAGLAAGGRLAVFFPPAYDGVRPEGSAAWPADGDASRLVHVTVDGADVDAEIKGVSGRRWAFTVSPGKEPWPIRSLVAIHIGPGGDGAPAFGAPKAATPSFRPIVAADWNGDGRFTPLPLAGALDIRAAHPVRAAIVAPSVVAADRPFDVTLTFFDEYGNPAVPRVPIHVTLDETPVAGGAEETAHQAPPRTAVDEAWTRLPAGSLTDEGYRYLRARFRGEIPPALSNPILVTRDKKAKRLYFGDLRGYSSDSAGLRTPEEYHAFASGPGALSFAALTDESWRIGTAEWERQTGLCVTAQRAGDYVPLLGWDIALGAGATVIYDDCDADPAIPASGPREDWELLVPGARPYSWARTPAGFLAGHAAKRFIYESLPKNALLIPYAPASPARGDDLDHLDLGRTRALEISSRLGVSETPGDPRRVEPFTERGSAVSALARGFHVGVVGASGGYDSRPGASDWGPGPGGLTAFWSGALTRRTVFDAVANGRTYATTGERIILSVSADGRPAGRDFQPKDKPVFTFEAAGTRPLLSVEIVKNGRAVYAERGDENFVLTGEWTDKKFAAPSWYYVRVTQTDGRRAWSSPYFLTHPDYAAFEKISAGRAEGAATLSWQSRFGRKTKGLTVLTRYGDDGGGKPAAYMETNAAPGGGKASYRDPHAPMTGVTTYFLLVEKNDAGDRVLGPFAAPPVLPVSPLPGGGWRLGCYVSEAGDARVEVLDENAGVIRVFDLGRREPGYHEALWKAGDGADLAWNRRLFYRQVTAGRTGPKHAMAAMPGSLAPEGS
ncbi:MAG: DUF3604 domain-containing protein [Deltaproteobacteria bacterium]|nr:DUF3604 domain-containing protein [Deltaproteobacteria bacterium]